MWNSSGDVYERVENETLFKQVRGVIYNCGSSNCGSDEYCNNESVCVKIASIQGYCPGIVASNYNPVPPTTRLKIGNNLSYCDPMTLGFIKAQAKNTTCFNDYQCVSNSCVEGVCQEFATEFRNQTSLLQKIWCSLTSFINNLTNATQRTAAYNSCMASGVSGG